MPRFLIKQVRASGEPVTADNWSEGADSLAGAFLKCDAVYGVHSSGVRQEVRDVETGNLWFRTDGELSWTWTFPSGNIG